MGVATGTFQLPNGSPVANGLYQWKLSQDTIEYSVACVCPPLFTGMLDGNGNLTATFLFNDALLPSLSTYQLTIKALSGAQVWNEFYYLTGTAANLNALLPTSSGGSSGSVGIFGSVVLTGSVPTVAASQLGIGYGTATAATTGSIVPPGSVAGYLVMNLGGTNVKVPYYNN